MESRFKKKEISVNSLIWIILRISLFNDAQKNTSLTTFELFKEHVIEVFI